MASRIVHFGIDACQRIPVLKVAGYSIDKCHSVAELHTARVGVPATDAVVIVEDRGAMPQKALTLIRSTTAAPLILFQSDKRHYDESRFDMVVPVLIDPQSWLRAIAGIIDRSSQLTNGSIS